MCRHPGENKYSGPDDGSDAKRAQLDGSEHPPQPVLSFHFVKQHLDWFLREQGILHRTPYLWRILEKRHGTKTVKISGFFILVHLRRPMIMLPGGPRPQPLCPGIFLASLFGRFYSDLLGICFGPLGTPNRHIF
jgi:hypothetical protein